jgi:plasmid stability protein
MAVITIRGVDDHVKQAIRERAARHGRSMEAELRAILTDAAEAPAPERGLGSAIHALFADIGGAELPIPARTDEARAADFLS